AHRSRSVYSHLFQFSSWLLSRAISDSALDFCDRKVSRFFQNIFFRINNNFSRTNHNLTKTNHNFTRTSHSFTETNHNFTRTNHNFTRTNHNFSRTNQNFTRSWSKRDPSHILSSPLLKYRSPRP
ncbi:unnamed protein product, partial [Sphacelaria rigidula]